MSKKPKLRDVDPYLHMFVVVAFTIIAVCVIIAIGNAL